MNVLEVVVVHTVERILCLADRCIDRREYRIRGLPMSEWCYTTATKYYMMQCCRNVTLCNKHMKPALHGKLHL